MRIYTMQKEGTPVEGDDVHSLLSFYQKITQVRMSCIILRVYAAKTKRLLPLGRAISAMNFPYTPSIFCTHAQ